MGDPDLKPRSLKLASNTYNTAHVCLPQGELYIIDVSQSVDLDHPKAFDFLREDCKHVNDYFRKNGVATLTVSHMLSCHIPHAAGRDLGMCHLT